MINFRKKMFKVVVISIAIIFSGMLLAADLTVVSFGGAYGAAQKKHMIDTYAKKTGTSILFEDYSGGVAELKAQVESGNVTWDVLDMEYIDVERACSEGMLEILPVNELPKGENGSSYKKDFVADSLTECAVGIIVWSTVVGYRNDVKKKPKTIKHFFDTKRYPGKRALRKRPQINLEWALIADGVSKKNVYKVLSTEAGVARAFKKLDTIKDDIVWFESWSQAPQLLNDGTVTMAQSANGRIYGAIKDDGRDFSILWDSQAYDMDGWTIPKGSKNITKAWDFIKESTKTVPLAGMQDVAYGPTRKSSSKYISKSVLKDLPSAHVKKGIKVNASFWADNDATLTERFTAWSIK